MVVLGLGSNSGDRLAYLRQALKYLRSLQTISVVQVSPVYESNALLPENAPRSWHRPYLNAAISCKTCLRPKVLLQQLQKIESQIGRARGLKWSPRIIDIDILAWDEECYQSEELCIPHADLLTRPFALWPLADLIPSWRYCTPGKSETGIAAQEIIKKWGSRFSGKAPFCTKQIAHRIDTPEMVAAVNVTPDSFSDGGLYNAVENAVEQVKYSFISGADVIDIGAESTRPNCQGISSQTEWQRLGPVLEAISSVWKTTSFRPKISIDTRNAQTVKKALAFDIDWINDQTGLTNTKMRQVVIDADVKLVFMHNLTIPVRTDVVIPYDKNEVAEVYKWAECNLEQLQKIGIGKERLIFDVGIGFGKTAEQSFHLIQRINEFKSLSLPLLVGHSRKSYLSRFTNQPFSNRDVETMVITNFLANANIDYLRVHNVDFNMRALKIHKALG
jgi:2-amino-4-hydroxy-6-hydroxymethyldihydropteridine diphosphokinase/dihydropteroate synthase